MSKTWTFWWVALVVVLTTIEYRIDLGFISIALVEPVVLLGTALILFQRLRDKKQIYYKEPLLLLFVCLTGWALLIRPFSLNWTHGLSDIRDWIVPTLTLFALLNIENPRPRQWLTVFAVLVVLNSLLSIFQHYAKLPGPFVNDLSVYKTEILPDGSVLQRASAGSGFFGSPNGLGMFFSLGIPMLFAWLRVNGVSWGIKRYALMVLPLVGLYFTYSKLGIVVTAIIVGVLAMHYLVPSQSAFLKAVVGGGVLGILVLTIALSVLPYVFFRTLFWRVALWDIASVTIQRFPTILLVGNGIDLFVPLSFHGQPHNMYIYMLLEYGVIGLILTSIIFAYLAAFGLELRKQGIFEQDPILVPIWIALMGQLLVGTLETVWLTILSRELFVITVAMFLQLSPYARSIRVPRFRPILTPSV